MQFRSRIVALALTTSAALAACELFDDVTEPPPPDGPHLAIQTQPGDAASATPLGTQPVVEVRDDNGDVATGDNTTVVTAAIASGEGSLDGTMSVTATAGIATFTDLMITGTAGQHQLSFSAQGFASATSNAFTLRAGVASPAASAVSVSDDVIVVGQTAVITLQARDAQENDHDSGGLVVEFSASGGTSEGIIGETIDNGDGTYESSFLATASGTEVTISATIDGESVTSPLPTIRVSSGEPPTDVSVGVPIMDMGDSITYHGSEGGLYPGGSNRIPSAHLAAQPPIDQSGPYALMSLSMSNGRQEFCDPGQGSVSPQNCASWSFMGQADADGTVHPSLVIVNGAQGGADAQAWESPSASAYDVADQSLSLFGLGPEDLQIIWVKQANAGPTVGLPDPNADAFTLLRRLGNVVRAAKVRYPNLKQVYLDSRIWSCREGGLNGEPFAYEGGYAVKWLVEAQINQLATGEIDPDAGDLSLDVAPWLAWGAYLWADGANERSDGLTWSPADLATDCTHPSDSGEEKVGELLMDFFKNSEATIDWFVN